MKDYFEISIYIKSIKMSCFNNVRNNVDLPLISMYEFVWPCQKMAWLLIYNNIRIIIK